MRKFCSTPNVGYEITCQNCKENGLNAVYYGESGRPIISGIKCSLGRNLVGLSVHLVEKGLVVILKIYKKPGIQTYNFSYYLEKGPGVRNC